MADKPAMILGMSIGFNFESDDLLTEDILIDMTASMFPKIAESEEAARLGEFIINKMEVRDEGRTGFLELKVLLSDEVLESLDMPPSGGS